MDPISPAIAYWDRQPCGSLRSNFEVGSLAYFDQIRRNRYHVESHVPEFAGFNRPMTDQRVVELGCGIGTDATSFALAGARVLAIDASANSIALASMQSSVYGVSDRVTFCQYDMDRQEQLKEPGLADSADLVYSFGVIHHMYDPVNALVFARQCLRPGGQLRVMVYHKYSLKWLECCLGRVQPEAQSGTPIVRAYSRRDGRRLLKSCGFEVTDVAVRHVFAYRLPEYKAGVYRRDWRAAALPFEKLIGWHLLLCGRKR